MFGWLVSTFTPLREPSPLQAVKFAIRFLNSNPTAPDSDVIDHLIKHGCEVLSSTEIVQIVPIAFSRFCFRNYGIQFPKKYVLININGAISERNLASQQVYEEAWLHCAREADVGVSLEVLKTIACRSQEFQTIERSLQNGIQPAKIPVHSPILFER